MGEALGASGVGLGGAVWVTSWTVVQARSFHTLGLGLPEAAEAATVKSASAAATATAGFKKPSRPYPGEIRLKRALSGRGVGGLKRSSSARSRLSNDGPS
ncbi:MAG TPA: hypothetical protein VER07_02895 [Candidatus Polarisedimenticolia bacterium]|nr:hypothetical protein [Candidatus Polarisedimenticolia bacterium]